MEANEFEREAEKGKKITLRMLMVTAALLCVCLSFRFIPKLNDALSGKPEPVRALAETLAQKMANHIGNTFVIIVEKVENENCKKVKLSPEFGTDSYYLVTYSETLHCACFTLYGEPTAGSDLSFARVLSPATGQNYGRPLKGPVKVVPIENLNAVYSDRYLSSLNWNANPDASRRATLGYEMMYPTRSAVERSWMPIAATYDELEAAVARRRNLVNAVLRGMIAVCLLGTGFSIAWLVLVYRKFCGVCLPYDPRPGLWAFVTGDPGAIVRQAEEGARLRQQAEAEHARATALSKRAHDAIVGRLETISGSLAEGPGRDRIRQCLQRNDLGEMRNLLRELGGHAAEKSSEEKLVALLETLKEYSTPEEFDRSCEQAFEILKRDSFRQARSFAVQMHDELRARFKRAKLAEVEESGAGRTDNPA